MKGTALSSALDELGVDADNFRVLGLLPLVYVAWADGKVQQAERSLIHRLAKMNGWLGDEGDCLLTDWLEEPPTEEYVATGLEVLRSLSSREPPEAESLGALIAYCKDVATAAGGLFGSPEAVTDEELHALEEIADALGVDSAERWRSIAGPDTEDDDELPPGPKGHILVGNLLDFDSSPLSFLLDAANNYGDIVPFTVSNDDVYLLRKPEHVAHVLEDGGRIYRRGSEHRALAAVLGPSVLTDEGEVWERFRAAAKPAFDDKRIEGFCKTIVEATDRMLERWSSREDGPELDVVPELKRLVLELVGTFTMSADLGDPASELATSVAAILDHASHAMASPFRLHEASLARRRRFREAKDDFDEAFHDLVAKRRVKPEGDDLLSALMAPEHELSDKELESHVLAFLLAGHETTAVALAWTFYVLSRHAVAARRVCREVRDKLKVRKPTHRDVRVLTYTNMLIDEVLRLYPPVWSIDREARKDDTVDGVHIPKGAIVMLSPWVTHRSPEVWENPEGFDPERFNERAAAKLSPGAYFPFGVGPHTCIGSRLALMMMRLIVPRVLQRYRLDLVPGSAPEVDPQLTLEPKPGLRMRLREA